MSMMRIYALIGGVFVGAVILHAVVSPHHVASSDRPQADSLVIDAQHEPGIADKTCLVEGVASYFDTKKATARIDETVDAMVTGSPSPNQGVVLCNDD